MSERDSKLEQLCITTMRMLAVDAVQQANSGHPGLPLGAAPMAYILWDRFLKHNPGNPLWPDRDRFVLSAGHGSALLYSLLHLTGYDMSLEELRNFRQWGSKTPGHPERDDESGVQATTGPLGQGVGMSVGMALAERFLAHRFNRPGFPVIDHYTYALVSDGDLMEGVGSEAASLAGHLKLGKLIYLYDDNHISIEGSTDLTFTEDVGARFLAYGWHVQRIDDGNDTKAIEDAIRAAQQETGKPSLIMIRTHIGFGSPKQDHQSAHGEPLGMDGVKATKEFFNWPQEPKFFIPEEARAHLGKALERGHTAEEAWQELRSEYRLSFPGEAEELDRALAGELPPDWDADIPLFRSQDGPIATRAASGKVLNAIANRLPTMLGGSADLAPSNNTIIASSGDQSAENPGGRNLRFGVREHGMGAVINGMALHGGVVPYGGTFLIFSDYMRPSLRLSALMDVNPIWIFTHDSIGLGEDGPTHQPIEQISSLRAMPNFTVIRPADANETVAAWRLAMERSGPKALLLTRQKLPILDPDTHATVGGPSKGAYVLSDVTGTPDLLIVATGSEVHLALEAQERLLKENQVKARVISMPSWEIFAEQTQEYQDQVLLPDVKRRLAVEAGSPLGWCQWTGNTGRVIGLERFGASAPGSEVFRHLGFSVDNVVAQALDLLKSR